MNFLRGWNENFLRKWSGLLHFAAAEMQPYYLVLLSVLSVVDACHGSIRLRFHPVTTAEEFDIKLKMCNKYSSQSCGLADVVEMISRGNSSHWWYTDEQLRFTLQFLDIRNYLRPITLTYKVRDNFLLYASTCEVMCNQAAVCSVLVVLLCGLGHIAYNSAWDFRSGEYLACTLRFQRKLHLRLFIVVVSAEIMTLGAVGPGVVAFLPVLFAHHFKIARGFVVVGSAIQATLPSIAMPSMVAAFGLFQLWVPHEPNFNWTTARFAGLQFKRSWVDLFCQPNKKFASCLSKAICGAIQGASTLMKDDEQMDIQAGDPTMCKKLFSLGFEGSLLPGRLRSALYAYLTHKPLGDLVDSEGAAYFYCGHQRWEDLYNEAVNVEDSYTLLEPSNRVIFA